MTTTDTDTGTAAHRTGYEIIVNAEPYRVPSDIVSYDEVVNIAFPNHPVNPNIYFEVFYKNADASPRDSSLLEGETVKVKNGTVFHVTQTDRS